MRLTQTDQVWNYKAGIIEYALTPDQISLEERLNQLFEGDNQPQGARCWRDENFPNNSENVFSEGLKLYEEKLFPLLNDTLKDFRGALVGGQLAVGNKTEIHNSGNVTNVYYQWKVNLKVPADQKEIGEQIKEVIQSVPADMIKFNYELQG